MTARRRGHVASTRAKAVDQLDRVVEQRESELLEACAIWTKHKLRRELAFLVRKLDVLTGSAGVTASSNMVAAVQQLLAEQERHLQALRALDDEHTGAMQARELAEQRASQLAAMGAGRRQRGRDGMGIARMASKDFSGGSGRPGALSVEVGGSGGDASPMYRRRGGGATSIDPTQVAAAAASPTGFVARRRGAAGPLGSPTSMSPTSLMGVQGVDGSPTFTGIRNLHGEGMLPSLPTGGNAMGRRRQSSPGPSNSPLFFHRLHVIA